MEEEKVNDQLSEDVQDILKKVPHWLIRFGMAIFLGVLILTLAFCYLIRYPDIVAGRAIITKVNPPVKISASGNHTIKTILVENSATVKKGTVLIEFENTTSLNEIRELEVLVEKIETSIENESDLNVVELSQLAMGENEQLLVELQRLINDYNNFFSDHELQKKIELIEGRIRLKDENQELLEKNYRSIKEKILMEKKAFSIQENLFEKSVISEADFIEKKINFHQNRTQLDEFNRSLIQNKISIHDDRISISDLKYQKKQYLIEIRSDMDRVISEIKNYIKNWYLLYTLSAPQSGELTYLRNFYTNEYITSGENLFAINTSTKEIIAYAYLPAKGYGKVKKGQKVHIMLENYPFQDFGYLEGEIREISIIPSNDEYLTTIALSNDFKTTYNRKINYNAEIYGTAEVVVNDIKLIDKLFNNFKKLDLEL